MKPFAEWPLRSFLQASLIVAACSASAAWAEDEKPAATIRIALAGDSTVTSNAGWGDGFRDSFTGNVECINMSRGGRSSGSFVKEGLWKQLLDKKPDYVLIQFGHNDQPGHGKDRESDPETTYRANMERYVDEARAAGITPVLVTSLSRRQWGEDGKIHSTLVPYVEVVKKIATEKKIPLIDLHAISIKLYEELGKEAIIKLSPRKNADPNSKNSDTAAKENGGIDGTHLNRAGSQVVGPLVAAELVKVVPELAKHLRTAAAQTGSEKKVFVVAGDGSGDFKEIQAAIDAAPENSREPVVIHIKPGEYFGQLIVPKNKTHLTLEGEDATTTRVTWDRNVNEEKPPGADKFNPGLQVKGDDFAARDLTIENTSGDHGQALAVRMDADRGVFSHCRIIGWQDTLMANNGRDFFRDCYIAGRVDFIYGSGTVWFENCEVHSRNGGYVTASNAPENQPFGFVFNHCRLTGDDIPWQSPNAETIQPPKKPSKAALGRPWRPFASVTFMNCELGEHIKPEGWDNWGKPDSEKTARYAEFKNTGPGAQPGKRVSWAKQLTAEEAGRITVETVLSGADHWSPAPVR